MKRPDQLASQIDLLLSDANGVPRGKTIDSSSFDENDLPRMAEAVLFQCINGDYTASAMASFNPKDADLIMQPDWSTYRRTPWKEGEVGQVICRALSKEGDPLPYDARNVLNRVIKRYQDKGLEPIVAPEMEFYLLDPPKRGDISLTPGSGFDGRDEFGGEAFSFDALDRYGPLVSSLQDMCAQAHIDLSAIVHEVGPGQIELNVSHGPVLAVVDQMFLLKRLVKGCALNQGYLASFMAKPSFELPGSGLHVHCSMLNAQGVNIFSLINGQAPATLQHFIGGLQHYLPEAFALLAPNVNSYKRFIGGQAAPINLAWGYDNRSTGLRVPYGPDDAGRVEIRIAGADANPYLLLAAILAAGLMGLEEALTPEAPSEQDAWDLTTDLPDNMAEGLRRLQASEKFAEAFSKEFIEVYLSVKRSELKDFSSRVSSWEVHYLGSML